MSGTMTAPPARLILVTGPARSGKSEWAESLAIATHQPIIYIATSLNDPTDLEWQARIAAHQIRRPIDWQTWEIPEELVESLTQIPPQTTVLVDSLGTWVANLLELSNAEWLHIMQNLLTILNTIPCPIIFVAEEVGWGIVPAYPLGRSFRDRLGRLVREIGAIADQVYLVTGGYALDLRQLGTPILKQPERFPHPP
jgi:adenosylcobinamide kinase / adenosylcobinamide-phosphate guanylyltransferase